MGARAHKQNGGRDDDNKVSITEEQVCVKSHACIVNLMEPGCFQCFDSLWMGLQKSKSRRREHDDVQAAKRSTAQLREFSPVHSDNVNSVEAFGLGVCLSGSADKVCLLIVHF